MSFAVQLVAQASLTTILITTLYRWKPSLKFPIPDLKQIFKYSANLTGFNFIEYIAANSDKFLVGKLLGSAAMGAYYIAFRLVLMPLEQINAVVNTVIFSTLSVVQEEQQRFEKIFLKLIYLISCFSAPFTLFFCATADLTTLVMFGDKWGSAASVLAILAPAGLVRAVTSPTGIICMVKDRTEVLLKLSLIGMFVIPLCVFIGLQWGLNGAAAGFTVASFIMVLPVLMSTLRIADISIPKVLRAVATPICVAFLCASCMYTAKILWLSHTSIPAVLQLLILILGGSTVYLLIIGTRLIREIQQFREGDHSL